MQLAPLPLYPKRRAVTPATILAERTLSGSNAPTSYKRLTLNIGGRN